MINQKSRFEIEDRNFQLFRQCFPHGNSMDFMTFIHQRELEFSSKGCGDTTMGESFTQELEVWANKYKQKKNKHSGEQFRHVS